MTDVLVPLDGSALSESALPLAIGLAKPTGSQLRLIEAVPPTAVPAEAAVPIEPMLDETNRYLAGVASRLQQESGIQVTTLSRYGFPTDAILELAADPAISLIVMSTHGRTGLARTLLGSVAEQVLRLAPVPVFLLRASETVPVAPASFRRIVVPLDGSVLAHTVLEPVKALARQFGSEIILVEVAPPPEVAVDEDDPYRLPADEEAALMRTRASDYLCGVQREVATAGLESRLVVRFGDPAETIVRVTEQVQADAIALSTHGRTGLDRLRHGSVAEDVLRHSSVPVMTLGLEAIKRLQATTSR